MKKLLILIFPFTILFLSCVYDPPRRGKIIIIENQTDNYIFVSDSLKGYGYFNIYDTFLVNRSIYISAHPNYIPQFTKWQKFLSDIETNAMENNSVSQIVLYFIKGKDVLHPVEDIRTNRLYDSINISLDEIKKNDLNYIFYYKDSIILRHEFSMSAVNNLGVN